MRNDWRKATTNITIGGVRCIESRHSTELPNVAPKREISICGRYGQIWNEPNGEYRVWVWSRKIQNRVIDLVGSTETPGVQLGDELVLYVTEEHLAQVIETLRVPKSQATQVRLANSI